MVLKVRFRVAKGQKIPWGFIRGQISKRHYLSVPYMLLKSQHAEFFWENEEESGQPLFSTDI